MFQEIGCHTEIERTLGLVRGKKQIDIYVEDKITTPNSIYLCECKFWKNPIPQDVIHSFRTIIADSGAHRGFVVSKIGFQKGAFEAAEKSNVELVTFDQLQKIFIDRWLMSMGRKCMAFSDMLFPYWDYSGGKQPKGPWTDEHRQKLLDLNYKYSVIIDIGPTTEMQGSRKNFPIEVPDPNSNATEKSTVTIYSYRSYFDLVLSLKAQALKDYQILFGEIET